MSVHAAWQRVRGVRAHRLTRACPAALQFATLHPYPDAWGFKAPRGYEWFGPNFLEDRAKVAHALGKPIVLGEYGMRRGGPAAAARGARGWSRGALRPASRALLSAPAPLHRCHADYLPSREPLMTFMQDRANENDH